LVEYLRSRKPVILVRHGQSYSNTDPKVGGWQDPGLTPLGHEQALAVAARLGELLEGRDVAVYSSHLRRALETAEPIIEAIGCNLVVDESLQEYRTNLDPGLSRPSAEKYKISEVKPAKHWRTFKDAESLGELYLRAGRILGEIVEQGHEVTVIVSHGWIMDKMIAWWVGVSLDDIKPNMFATGNASISVLSVTQFGERVLLKLNDTGHLMHLEHQDSFLE